jgi:hypothetical protein
MLRADHINSSFEPNFLRHCPVETVFFDPIQHSADSKSNLVVTDMLSVSALTP